MTAAEAEEKWAKVAGTVRRAISDGRFDKWIEEGQVKKSKGTWLVSERAMRDVFGERP